MDHYPPPPRQSLTTTASRRGPWREAPMATREAGAGQEPGSFLSNAREGAMSDSLKWETDSRIDACYATLTDAKIVRTVAAGPSVNFDVDKNGRPVGIEVLGGADWTHQLVKLFLRGEVRLVHGFDEDEP